MIYAGGAIIAEVAGTQTAAPEYRLLDHLGSLAVQTDNSGNVTGANVFLPFGQLMSSTTNDSFQFTGLEQDTENSSDHAWFRNLSTEQSRWLRPDPYLGSYDIANPQSLNRYAYVLNNPLSFVDPSGLDLSTSGSCVYDTVFAYVNGQFDSTETDLIGCFGGGGGGGFGMFFGSGGGRGGPGLLLAPGSNRPGPGGGITGPPSSVAPSKPTPQKTTTPKSQCVAQVQVNAQKTRKIIDAAGGLTLENTTAACLFAGPGAPECLFVVDPVVLINTGVILAGEWYNTSQEEAACAQ